jgi:hypothetical protein
LFVAALTTFLGRFAVKWLRDQLGSQLSAIDKKATPNGGDTLDLGDTVARIEGKQDEQRDLLLWHLAHHPGLPIAVGVPVPPLPETLIPTRAAVEANNTDDAMGQHQFDPGSHSG